MFRLSKAFLALGASVVCALTPASAASAASQSAPAGAGLIIGSTSTSNSLYPTGGGGTFQIHNVRAAGKCIGISAGLAGDWNCTTNPDQTWHWGPANSFGFNELINGNGQCLAVSGGSVSQGARILGYSCLGTSDQYWLTGIDDDLLNYNWVANVSAVASVVGVGGASTANGAPLVLWSANTSTDQKWY